MMSATRKGYAVLGALAVLAGVLAGSATVQAREYPVTDAQRAAAQQVSERGIPLSELTNNAPDVYVVKRGDTLWGISGMYLQRPWRWPELWGMNLEAITNPHRIFPGQTLYLDRNGGFARLRTSPVDMADSNAVVRLSPRTRELQAQDAALPTLQPHLLEPFLEHPLVVDDQTIALAPRIVAARNEAGLLSVGDRAYARGAPGEPLELAPGVPRQYYIFRDTMPLKDPVTGAVLGYEAQYVGRADLVRGESLVRDSKDPSKVDIIPATVDLSRAKQEVRLGDRLLPATKRGFSSYVPHAPIHEVEAHVLSLYGNSAVINAGHSQVISINRGTDDGIEQGHVLKLMNGEQRMRDKTDKDRPMLRLPSEDNGLAMVFLTFDRVSYALIVSSKGPVNKGDKLVNPD